MKVLVACERSGIVRNEFRRRGHDAWSCDLADSETPGNHIKGDVLDILDDGWDLMIAHPPCTHLSLSGARYFKEKRKDGRQKAAIDFFMALAGAPVSKYAIENPMSIVSRVWRKPDQTIQPWQFGEDASKATCLWLKGLPLLKPTHIIYATWACYCGARFKAYQPRCPQCDSANIYPIRSNQTPSGQQRLGQSPDRARIRSQTFRGVAEAMADQWGETKPQGFFQ